MFIETWTFWCLIGIFILIALITLVGWMSEGVRLEREREENRRMRRRLSVYERKEAHQRAVENIKAANEYYEQDV